MQPQIQCPVCQGRRITPPTQTCAATGFPYLMYASPDGGFFDQDIRLRWVGSACLDCGHVILFLAPDSLNLARQQQQFNPNGS